MWRIASHWDGRRDERHPTFPTTPQKSVLLKGINSLSDKYDLWPFSMSAGDCYTCTSVNQSTNERQGNKQTKMRALTLIGQCKLKDINQTNKKRRALILIGQCKLKTLTRQQKLEVRKLKMAHNIAVVLVLFSVSVIGVSQLTCTTEIKRNDWTCGYSRPQLQQLINLQTSHKGQECLTEP